MFSTYIIAYFGRKEKHMNPKHKQITIEEILQDEYLKDLAQEYKGE